MKYFTLSALKELGFGKTILEKKIHDEIRCVVEELRVKNGCAFDISRLLQNSVSNVMCSLIFGHRFHYNDTKFHRLVVILTERFKRTSLISELYRFPQPGSPLSKLLSFWKSTHDWKWELNTFVENEIELHSQQHPETKTKDFINAFTKEMENRKDDPLSIFTGEL